MRPAQDRAKAKRVFASDFSQHSLSAGLAEERAPGAGALVNRNRPSRCGVRAIW